ncbi:MAG: porin [Bacteriovoracaceae bacterium]
MKKFFLTLLVSGSSFAATPVSFDGFVDLYYAYDFNRPKEQDRDYTTQPARNDEFNLNLALLGLTHKVNRLTARLSFQAGTYVQANYAAEPTEGNTSGGLLSRHIQDAYVRYQLHDKTTLIAGIMPSHIGYEGVLSIDNYTYTRSLAADFSPYYQSGAGLLHMLSESLAVEGYVLNGWQNISEDDSSKALGTALRFNKDKLSINYTTYFGSYLGQSRQFHDFNVEYRVSDKLKLKALYDFGIQDRDVGEDATFSTFNIQASLNVQESHRVSLRFEKYKDEKQANITTHTNQEFDVSGGSLGYDISLEEGYTFRTEYRYLKATQNIFKKKDGFSDSNQTLSFSIAAKF